MTAVFFLFLSFSRQIPGYYIKLGWDRSLSQAFQFRSSLIILLFYAISISLWLYRPLLVVDRFFGFLLLYTIGMIPWTGGSACHKAATYTQNNTNTEKSTQISMPRVEFERTIPVFEQAKTVHSLHRTAIVIGLSN
jgi:hypothetical protein